MEHTRTETWSIEDAAALYRIEEWGNGYFHINADGEVEVRLKDRSPLSSISLLKIAKGLQERGMKLPVLLRFSNILDDRIQHINESFAQAIKDVGYQGCYRGVYPIKVNQQQQVVEEITKYGKQYHHGLETGSKAELIAAQAYIDDPEACIICNGYKDEEYIDLALRGISLGINTVLVIEMPGETEIILERARVLKIKPNIGIRMKPSTVASGHWTDSGGDRSVFGLNTTQVITVVDTLKREGMLDCLKMLHYHLGSQIPNIHDIRIGATEATRFYAGLIHEGAPMGLLDIGGGLAIDYDGSRSNSSNSRNYTTKEYCDDIVEEIMSICKETKIPHPTIISESGRALVSYYSVLLFNILDTNIFWDENQKEEEIPEELLPALDNLLYVREMLNEKNTQECLNDLNYYREEIRNKFLYGTVNMRERAVAEHLYWSIIAAIYKMEAKGAYLSPQIKELEHQLSDIFYGNFSLFQSLPDVWAIDQLFPIMPIHLLDKKPDRKAILSDITCDSEGKIDQFIGRSDHNTTLPLHTPPEDDDYILGVFLVGAYQETLGDLHNLLGDTNVVSITYDEEGKFLLHNELEGDTVADVLSYVEYDPKQLEAKIRTKAERAVQDGLITTQQRRKIISAYTAGLRGYTYYETDQED
ncbi:arginine decarboxylase, biosynthetic [Sphaerochaeta pleomorpha str. Grapes]|uniref:Arginine decarboxylase n=1 Tax=Sphaerochaeta pleomorpha (strain ATCC BAA-1885 / DSM 22778 / Grapes) TaxID=158190 RepID=G8QX90_SPHPG|nr:biosynthetic arginine decarboxylase [Sphaerochaeta pleomorpha]AEV30675.1 arginine decarboxylase, biosynthetic [Sphaerochaeta pleomorpha str. Grapes]